ncbi:Transcription factor TFIIIB component B [Mortierella sp. AD011]|nr:Transcription factor TFIIIB component B [Mortierella sp. AD010]KAF9401193.1 Transcription factor TFIIIB component B [Mortierella sp. AD011]
MPKLSQENLEKHSHFLQAIWFDPVSEYLDKLVHCDQFEPFNRIDIAETETETETENVLPCEFMKPELPTSTRESRRSSRRDRKHQNVTPLQAPVAESQSVYQPPLHDTITSGITTMIITPAGQVPAVKNEEIKREVISGANTNLTPGNRNRESKRNKKQPTNIESMQTVVKAVDASAEISPVTKTAANARRRKSKSDKQKERSHKGQDHPFRENGNGIPDRPAAVPAGGSDPEPLVIKPAHNPKIPRDSHEMPSSGGNNGDVKKNKGQKRFQPKLKARPNRNKPTVSEDGTPAPTPPIGGSDSGSFGSSLLELETTTSASSTATTATLIVMTQGDTETVVASAASSATLVQHTVTTASSVQKDLSRRLSTATPMSPPTQNKSIVSPRSPIVTPTKVTKDRTSQATAISIPSSDAGSSSAAHAISSSSNSALSKQSKGASVISVPTARNYSELEETDEMEEAEGSNSARKRSKGKSTRLRNQPIVYNDDGEEMTEDGEELVPDYANMYMYQFTRDLGVGKRSKVYQEHQKALETKRRVSKRKERIEAIRRMEGRGPSPTPGDDDDDDDEDRDDDDNDNLQDEDGSGNGEANKEEKTTRARSEINTPKPAPQPKTFAPQVRVVDGQIELDVDSLVVDHDIVEADTHQEPMEYVEESSTTKFVNNSSFTRKIASERWSEKDTDLFYEALAQWGTDFGIICRLFPSKTRIAVRNKYKREDRYNHSRVEEALNSRRPIDLDKYSKMIGTEFPEVSEEDLIKKLPDVDEDDQAPVGTPDFEDEYGDGEEIVEKKAQEEEAEEIIGMIE